MEVAFEKAYQQVENVNFQPIVAMGKEKKVDVAIALGPAVGNLIFKENLSRSLILSFEKEKIHIYYKNLFISATNKTAGYPYTRIRQIWIITFVLYQTFYALIEDNI